MIVGQDKLINFINATRLETFPHSLMLCGEYGSGKHLITDYIANRFSLPIENITETISLELIDNLYLDSTPKIYIIEIDKISYNEQNAILKFVEEPPVNSYIVLLVENQSYVLETIYNRCNVWLLEKYGFEVLSQFCENQMLCEIFTTPGQLIKAQNLNYDEMNSLAVKIITQIENANFSNTLTLVNKFDFEKKDDSGKYDLVIFGKLLIYNSKRLYKESVEPKYYNAYMVSNEFNNNLRIPKVDKKMLFYNYLIKLRKAMRGE